MTTTNLEAFGDINFPEHLTPKVIHSALFIHNAKDKAETITRVKLSYQRSWGEDNDLCYGIANLAHAYG